MKPILATPRAIGLFTLMTLAMPSLAGAADWVSGGTLPAPKQHAFGVELGGTIYAIGGTPWTNGGDQDGTVYRLSGGVWSAAAALDGAGPAVPIGGGIDGLGRIDFFGGILVGNGDPGSNRVYDPTQGVLGSIANPPNGTQQLGFAFATDGSGRLYWLGGGSPPAASGACSRYTASSNSWTVIAPMPMPVASACACYDGAGHILVVGGIPAGSAAPTADVQQFDIVLGTWSSTSVPDLPAPVSGARAVLGADNRIYVIGGVAANGTVRNAVDALNLATNTWSSAAPLAVGRKDFAAVRGTDNFIYAIGGTSAAGTALNSVERLFTTICPALPDAPKTVTAWAGQTAAITANVTGAGTITYQWTKDNLPLTNGTTGGGSVISGATTAALAIAGVGPADEGTYAVTASNDCGSVAGAVASLTIALPPAVPTTWTITSLHPTWAKSSTATCVSGSRQGGSAVIDTGGYLNVSQPVIWQGSAASALNVTPANSVGGAIADMEESSSGIIAVGWWWWPYACGAGGQSGTCYSSQAAKWEGPAYTFTNLQWSGWENSTALSVSHGVIGGSVTNDDAVGNFWWHALLWDFNGASGVDLQPAGVSSSSVEAIDGDSQFGTILTPYPGPTFHAARWDGSAANFTDMHPAGASASFINAAADGLQVGYTGYPYDGAKACLWSGTKQSYVNLHPAGATLSHAYAVAQGVVFGDATFGGVTSVGCWSLGSPTFTSLDAALRPAGFSYVTISAMQIAADGTFTLVGSGYNAALARTEALLWTSVTHRLGDVTGDGAVDAADLGVLLGAWGTADPLADLNGDGAVDAADLSILLGAWTA